MMHGAARLGVTDPDSPTDSCVWVNTEQTEFAGLVNQGGVQCLCVLNGTTAAGVMVAAVVVWLR
jgi:hypothetical protein